MSSTQKPQKSSILFIPNGVRRYAKLNKLDLLSCYENAADNTCEIALGLWNHFPVVGIYPLAAYNLDRGPEDRKALEMGILYFIQQLRNRLEKVRDNSVNVYLFGNPSNIENLIEPHDTKGWQVNNFSITSPLEHTAFMENNRSLVIYLAYDWEWHLRKSFENSSVPEVNWQYLYKTGCKDDTFRVGGVFRGLAHTEMIGTKSLILDVSLGTILDSLM
jgi:hypothetical protein